MKHKTLNVVAEGLSGKFGKRVYYQLHGQTFIRKAAKSYNKIPTEKQAQVRARFMEATQFAKTVIQDPVLKAEYQKRAKKRRSAFAQALSEFLKFNLAANM